METMNENQLRSRSAVVVTTREQELQKLLAEERVRSEQRKTNYSTLKEEHLKLQKDFLNLQTEMRQILSETKLIKDKKDEDLEQVLKVCEEKDKMIDTLKIELKERDPQLIRNHFEDELKEPIKKLQKTNEVLIRDKERVNYELKIAKQKIEFLEKESMDAIERIKLSFVSEINLIKREKEELRSKLLEANQLPDVKRYMELSEENTKLSAKVKSFQLTLEDAEQQYKKIQHKVETLVIEHENSEKEYEKQILSLNSQIGNLRDSNQNLRQQMSNSGRDKQELMADIEKLKTEINRLNKDLEEKDKYFMRERDRLEDIHNKNIKEIEDQKNNLQIDIKKFKLEIDAKNETISRLEQESSSKDKEFQLKITCLRQQEFDKRCAIEQEKTSIQTKLKDFKEEKSKLKEEIQQMRRQIENLSELRLTVERDSMILRAKVESYQINMDELDKLRRQHNQLHDHMNKLKSDNTEYLSLNKELIRQREQYKCDYQRVKDLLEEERKHLEEFKILSDKSLLKLRNCIEEERFEFKDKLLALERDVIKYKKEKEELRDKYKQYVSIADKLQTKLNDLKERQKLESSHQKSSQPLMGSTINVLPESYNQLKKELKLMKKRQNQMSNLLNCSFDSTHCKELFDKQS